MAAISMRSRRVSYGEALSPSRATKVESALKTYEKLGKSGFASSLDLLPFEEEWEHKVILRMEI